jgi:DNA-binding beta-propeller fold protein YncE
VTLPKRAEVVRIDSTSNGVADPIADTGVAVKQLAVGGGYVWGVLRGRDRVVRIDVSTQRMIGSPISVGDQPSDIAVGHGFVWVVNRRDNTVMRIPTTYPVSGKAGL